MDPFTTYASSLRFATLRGAFFAVAAALVMTACGGGAAGGNPGNGAEGGGGSGLGAFTATLEWESPTTNVDQSCLTNLAGYNVAYGNMPGAATYQKAIPINSLACGNTSTVTACGTVQTCKYTIGGLTSGQWYFTATSYNTDLVSGPASNEAAFTIN